MIGKTICGAGSIRTRFLADDKEEVDALLACLDEPVGCGEHRRRDPFVEQPRQEFANYLTCSGWASDISNSWHSAAKQESLPYSSSGAHRCFITSDRR